MHCYPFLLQSQNRDIFPLLGDQFTGDPHLFDYSSENKKWWEVNVRDIPLMEKLIQDELQENGKNWGIAGYLEDRSRRLAGVKHLMEEKRFYHLGIDIIVPAKTKLFAPMDGVVETSGYEEGSGNYGGYIILKHDVGGQALYSLYGHLDPNTLLTTGTPVHAGQEFGTVGDHDVNGNWTHHIHMQIITEKGKNEGWFSRGYCRLNQIPGMADICPNALFLFKYV